MNRLAQNIWTENTLGVKQGLIAEPNPGCSTMVPGADAPGSIPAGPFDKILFFWAGRQFVLL